MKSEIDRRNFMKLMALASGGMMLPPFVIGCSSCESNTAALLPETDAPFGVWKQMIELLEQSPDHLPGRRKALIASKDPKAMTEFVRDSFQLISGNPSRFLKNHHYEFYYGLEAAMRCGMATPREKAEILKDMLTEAGFEAKVVYEAIDFSEEELQKIIFQKRIPDFAPPISKKQMKRWQKLMNAEKSEGKYEEVKNYDELAKGFNQKLLSYFDKDSFAQQPLKYEMDLGRIPSVSFIEEGEEKFAHVFDPSVEFGNLHPKNEKQKTSEAGGVYEPKSEVHITLTAATAIEPGKEKELLKGTWNIKDLAGSMVFLQFLNNMSFEEQTYKTISQIDTFTPVLSFQKIGKDREYMEEHSVIGVPIDMNAVRLMEEEEEKDQTPVPAAVPVSDSLSVAQEREPEVTDSLAVLGETRFALPDIIPGKVQDVHEVEVKAIPKTFPKVFLEISPKDSEGNIVGGLTGKDFTLEDNGKAVSGKLIHNTFSPKLLLLYDTSGSMPLEYRRRENVDAFYNSMKSKVHNLFPHADVKLQETGSDIYTTMLKAKQSDYDVVLYCTDGDNNDRFNPVYTEIYEKGHPIIVLEVRPSSYTYDELKKNIANLISLPAVEQDRALEEVINAISQIDFPPYMIAYSSFDEKAEHKVKVGMKGTDRSGEDTFRFPEPNDEFIGDRIVGLYLTIQGPTGRIRRTLAGWDKDFNRWKPSFEYIREVHEMLLGGAVMAFEREAPTLAVRMTEYLEAKLSHEQWYKAHEAGDDKKAVELLEKGVLYYPEIMLTMMQPPADAFTTESMTIPYGMRASILKMKPGLYSDRSVISFDYLPTNKYRTLSKSGKTWENFKTNLETTMQFAVLESLAFDYSTLTELEAGNILEMVTARKVDGFNVKLRQEGNPLIEYRAFQERGGKIFFDGNLKSAAFFKVDEKTGEVFAMLPDGTGGGGKSVEAQLKELERVVKDYQRLQSTLGLMLAGSGAGFALGVVNAYGLTLVKMYAAAAEAIIIMDAGNIDKHLAEALQGLACSIMQDIVLLGFSRGTQFSMLQNLIGMMGGNASPC